MIDMYRYISGFDYLRVIFSILVVIWHAQSISFLGVISPYLQNFVNIFYYNVCLLAVPVFFSISLYLFYEKQLIYSTSFIEKRLANLIRLYCIWMFVGIVFNLLLSQRNYLLAMLDIDYLLSLIIGGTRPELFFLSSLIIICYLCFLNSKYFLSKKHCFKIQLIFILISLLILIFVDFYRLATYKDVFYTYWNPVCFIPYIFSSSILVFINKDTESELTKNLYRTRFLFILILSLIFIFLSWLEWQIFNMPKVFGGYLLPPYARPSLVVGSFLLCYCAILYKGKPSNLIDKLSQESLGIYLLHGYALFLIEFLVNRLQNLQFFQLLVAIIFNPIARVIFAVVVCLLTSRVLKNYEFGRTMLNSRSKGSLNP